jgi:hypothetical protein
MSQLNPSTSRGVCAVQVACAALCALATAMTVWRPDWIEVLGLGDPDRGSGAAERLVVAVLAVATIVAAATARRTWARLAAAG